MQSLPSKTLHQAACFGAQSAGFGLECGAVGGVPQNRMPDMGEMDANLVRSPCFHPACKKARHRLAVRPGKALQHLPMRYGCPSVGAHSLFVACMRVPPQGGFDSAFRTIRRPPYEREVAALKRPFVFLS